MRGSSHSCGRRGSARVVVMSTRARTSAAATVDLPVPDIPHTRTRRVTPPSPGRWTGWQWAAGR